MCFLRRFLPIATFAALATVVTGCATLNEAPARAPTEEREAGHDALERARAALAGVARADDAEQANEARELAAARASALNAESARDAKESVTRGQVSAAQHRWRIEAAREQLVQINQAKALRAAIQGD
jgi:hypothetical protein